MNQERWQGRSPLEAFPVSIGLLGACLVLFVCTDYLLPDGRGEVLKEWCANRPLAFLLGEFWRPVTSMFVHGGLLHVALNMFALWQLAPLLERTVGSARFAAVYFGSGIAASLVSMLFDSGSVGASGAIFGVVACYIRFERVTLGSFKAVMRHPGSSQLVVWVLINIALGLGINRVTSAVGGPGISNAAHIGGLVGGWAISAAVFPALGGYQRGRFEKRPSVLKLAVFGVALAVLGVLTTFNTRNAEALALEAYRASSQGKEERALDLLDRARKAPRKPRDAAMFFALGIEEHQSDRLRVAEEFYRLAEESGFHGTELGHNMALILEKRGDRRALLQLLRRWASAGRPLPGWEDRLAELEAMEARGELGR